MLFLLRTSSCHFTSLYSLTLLITNQTLFRVQETKQELEKRKNTLLDNDLGKQKEIQKANFYILNTQEKLHWIRVRELLTGFTIYNGFTMACILQLLFTAIGRGRTNAFGVYIGHKICHRVPATSATLLSRPAITMSEGPKDQKSRCPASKQVISCPMAVK